MIAGPPHQRAVSVTTLEGVEPFRSHHRRYDEWFQRHEVAYLSELLAVRALLPWQGNGLEIGVGTERFAGPLGVTFGIDPESPHLAMRESAGSVWLPGLRRRCPFRTPNSAVRYWSPTSASFLKLPVARDSSVEIAPYFLVLC